MDLFGMIFGGRKMEENIGKAMSETSGAPIVAWVKKQKESLKLASKGNKDNTANVAPEGKPEFSK